MAFDPSGKFLLTVSANDEHTIRIWDWRTGKLVDGPGPPGAAARLSCSPPRIGFVRRFAVWARRSLSSPTWWVPARAGGEAKGQKGTAPQEFGVVWDPWRGKEHHAFDFVTFGHKVRRGAVSARKSTQLQPFLAVLPQECVGQLTYFVA